VPDSQCYVIVVVVVVVGDDDVVDDDDDDVVVVVVVCYRAGSGPDQAVEEKASARINRHSVFWILASVALTYYLDFFSVLLNHSDIHR